MWDLHIPIVYSSSETPAHWKQIRRVVKRVVNNILDEGIQMFLSEVMIGRE